MIAGDQAQHLAQDHVKHLIKLQRGGQRGQNVIQRFQAVADVVGEVENQQKRVVLGEPPNPYTQRLHLLELLVNRDDHFGERCIRLFEDRLPARPDRFPLVMVDEIQGGTPDQVARAVIEILFRRARREAHDSATIGDDHNPIRDR